MRGLSLALVLLCVAELNKLVKGDTKLKSGSLPLDCGQSLSSTLTQNKVISAKITGGKEARRGEFPWMVAVFGPNGKHSCGGSLIRNDFVLTAAHCFASYNGNELSRVTVSLGDHNIRSLTDGPHETRKVSRAILHKGFDIKTYHNDIALLKLAAPATFTSSIHPICLPMRNDTRVLGSLEGAEAVVAGWGRLMSGLFGLSSATLRKVQVPVWKMSDCRRVYDRFAPGRLMGSNICAGDGKKNKDACIGDSGGPLMLRTSNSVWYQVGTVSWGKGCGSYPGVYTDTRKYMDWIQKNLEANSGTRLVMKMVSI